MILISIQRLAFRSSCWGYQVFVSLRQVGILASLRLLFYFLFDDVSLTLIPNWSFCDICINCRSVLLHAPIIMITTRPLLPIIKWVGSLKKLHLAVHLVMSLCHDPFLRPLRYFLRWIPYHIFLVCPFFSWCCWGWLPTEKLILGALKPVWRLPAV